MFFSVWELSCNRVLKKQFTQKVMVSHSTFFFLFNYKLIITFFHYFIPKDKVAFFWLLHPLFVYL